MAYTIAFFGTKPYDESSFTDKNKEFGFEIRYYKGHLNKNNVLLTQGVDAVCIFVNDIADAEVLRIMASNGVKLLALRCAGFNNVDLNAAAAAGITVVRVPAVFTLCGCRIYRSSHAIPQPENSPCLLAYQGRKLFPSRTHGVRYARKNSRHHRHGKDCKDPDPYSERVRHEHIGLRPLSGL